MRKTTGRFAKKLQTYLKPSVLVLDEVGYPGTHSGVDEQTVGEIKRRGVPK